MSISLPVKGKSIAVYPNPSHGTINFTSLEKVKTIEIYNASGIMLKTFKVTNPQQLDYDISNLSTGMYFIRLLKEDNQASYLKVELLK
ncbi:MAG: T9SS type A sorting domain-containing protein [Chitinophagaceae bacterium]